MADETSTGSASPWMIERVHFSTPPLVSDSETDVCVIGAGISGLSVAYSLLEKGLRVIVIDDGPIGDGETARTTAHLSSYLDDRFSALEALHGGGGASLAYQSHARAIDRIEAVAVKENIDCSFRRVDGYLFDKPETRTHNLKRELEASLRAGIVDCELIHQVPLIDFDTGQALRFPNQAQIHPMKYLYGLAQAIVMLGGVIHEDVHATEVIGGAQPSVKTENGRTIRAKDVVVATNAPIHGGMEFSLKEAAYRSYTIGLVVPTALVMPALYWDFDDPYHYVRLVGEPRPDGSDVLLVGGEDHRTGQDEGAPEARYARLEAFARLHFPMCREVIYQWSGQVLESIDGLAFIGREPKEEHIYCVTGDSGQGMTHGTIAGMLVSDLICKIPNEWESLYDPSRRTLRAVGSFLSEAIKSIGPYSDWAAGGDVQGTDSIALDSGAVVQRGLSKLAIYKDSAGECHEKSATCPHLGGVVRWNAAERSWDCPCHGSRFDAYGKVLNGPANRDLDDPKEPTILQEEPREDADIVEQPLVGIA